MNKMVKYLIGITIFFFILELLYIFGIPSSSKSKIWEIFFPFYLLYFTIFRIIKRRIGEYAIHAFFKESSPGTHSNPFNPSTLAAILFFCFVISPFLFFISYSSTILFQHFFENINTLLSEAWPNVFLQSITAFGFLAHIWVFCKRMTNP